MSEKKTEEQLRQEICEEFDWNEDDNKEQIDKVLQIKKDRYVATQRQKKAQEEADLLKKGKDFYKAQAKEAKKPKKGKDKPNEQEARITADDKAYLYGRLGYARTEVRYLEKIMKITGKKFPEAIKDNLFTSWKSTNDALIKRRGASLSASRGGSSAGEKGEQEKIVKKFAGKLPKGFSYDPKRKIE